MSERNERYFLGITSGPTADGVDAALAAVKGAGELMRVRQVRSSFTPYPPALRRRITEAISAAVTPAEIARLNRDVADAFATAAKALLSAARVARRKLAGVGSGGQTIAYAPATATDAAAGPLEIGSAAVIAQRIALPVVTDFAAGDVAIGGRGAPLSAWPHWVMFSHEQKTRVIVALGAVATVTFLPAGGVAADTLAFEAGPGMTLIDALAERFLDAPCDIDGAVAAKGTPNGALLHELLANPYFHQPPPKACGHEAWAGDYLRRVLMIADKHNLRPADLIATATELTAQVVATAIAAMTENPHEVFLCGGGAKNIHLAMRLRKLLTPASTMSVEKLDIDAKAAGAIAYAVLAAARIDGFAANVPQATGAERAALMGAITRA